MWSVLFLCFSKYASHTKAERSNVLTGFDRGGDILVQDRALTVNNSTDFFKSLCQSVWKTMWMCFDTSTVKLHAKHPSPKWTIITTSIYTHGNTYFFLLWRREALANSFSVWPRDLLMTGFIFGFFSRLYKAARWSSVACFQQVSWKVKRNRYVNTPKCVSNLCLQMWSLTWPMTLK